MVYIVTVAEGNRILNLSGENFDGEVYRYRLFSSTCVDIPVVVREFVTAQQQGLATIDLEEVQMAE